MMDEHTPLIILRLDDGDREFMTMGEACRYVRDNGTPGYTGTTRYALGGEAVVQSYRLGSEEFTIRTRWSESEVMRFGEEDAHYEMFINATSYIIAGENATTPREVKLMFRHVLGERTSLDMTAVDHMSEYDVDWFADTDMCMRGIEFQFWDEFKELYKDDEEGWRLLADWLQAAWDAQCESIRRAVTDVQRIITDIEGRRGEYTIGFRDRY